MIPTFSPQGDGNPPERGRRPSASFWPKLIPTFSPQGDGNGRCTAGPGASTRDVDPYLFPARGRKPPIRTGSCSLMLGVDPYLFPARGRKRRPGGPRWPPAVDPYLFPARGRKLCSHKFLSRRHAGLIPTFSPQGDGNGTSPSSRAVLDEGLLIPTFSPQGDGNTERLLASYVPVPKLIPTFSPQGDGNNPGRLGRARAAQG